MSSGHLLTVFVEWQGALSHFGEAVPSGIADVMRIFAS